MNNSNSLTPFDGLPVFRKRSRKWLWLILYPAGMVLVVSLTFWIAWRS